MNGDRVIDGTFAGCVAPARSNYIFGLLGVSVVEPLPTLSLWGEQFSPRRAEELTGLTLSGRVEPGELAYQGRYKGQPSPYGAAYLAVPPDIEQGRRLAWVVAAADAHLPVFQRVGATVCKLHLDIRYWDQCNLEFSSRELERIAALGVPFTISCWDYSGQDEPTASRTSSADGVG